MMTTRLLLLVLFLVLAGGASVSSSNVGGGDKAASDDWVELDEQGQQVAGAAGVKVEEAAEEAAEAAAPPKSAVEVARERRQQVAKEDEGSSADDKTGATADGATSAPATNPFFKGEVPFANGFFLELAFLVVAVASVVSWYLGKSTNEAIASAVASKLIPIFQKEFPNLVDPLAEKNPATTHMTKEGHHVFRLGGAGRKGVQSGLATLSLRKRHLLTSLLAEAYWPAHDEIELDFMLQPEVADSFVFALVDSQKLSTLRQDSPDISACATIVKNASSYGLAANSTLTACSELDEVPTRLLGRDGGNFPSILKDHGALVKLVHYSDRSVANPKVARSLRVVLTVPTSASAQTLAANMNDQFKPLVEGIFAFLDTLTRFKLSPAAKVKVVSRRQKLDAPSAKEQRQRMEEAAQERKAAKLQAERERIRKLPPDQRQREEEKLKNIERKRREKKMQGKKMIRMG